MNEHRINPASAVIEKFGGVPSVSAITSVHPTRVYCWMKSKSKGGTGGTIPQKHIPKLIAEAKRLNIDLEVSDFFEEPA